MNYRLLIQYDGTDFHGWQIQAKGRTVQGEIQKVLTMLDGNSPVGVNASGRTDAGVHAEGQVVNAHLKREFEPARLRGALNGNLPRDVRVLKADIVPDDFHARFSATGKTYVYRVLNHSVASPFWARYALHDAREFDLARMKAAAKLFVGVHDWTAFSAANSDANERVRNLTELEIKINFDSRANADLIEFRVSAEGFLRYMVRSIVGTLLAVGRGEMTSEQVLRAIETGERSLAGATAAAHGLTLLKVRYD